VILVSLIVAVCGAPAVDAQTPLPAFTFPDDPVRESNASSSGRQNAPDGEKAKLAQPAPGDATVESSAIIETEPARAPTFRPSEFRIELAPTIRLRGRIEAESVVAAQSAQSQATIGDLQNGFGFRRIRLGAQGTIEESTSWVSEVELAGGDARVRDVFVGLDAIPGFSQIRIGHFREPYNLEGMTSSNFITFLERSPANVLSPVRNWGVCGYWWPADERLLYSVGVFRDGTDNGGQSVGDDDNWAYTTRLTGLPIYEPDGAVFRLIHLGAAFSQRVPPNGLLRFSPRIVSNLLTVEDNPGSPFLPSLVFAANDYQLYNLQFSSVRGSFSLQAEWSAATVQQTDAGMVFVHGMYLSGSYLLTGEHRGYNRTRGSFDQVEVLRPLTRSRKVQGGFGAVELAMRFAFLNFDSANMPVDANGNFVGTQLYELTFGVNWYLNTNTRIMADYTAGMPDKVGFEPTVAHVYGVRTAIYW